MIGPEETLAAVRAAADRGLPELRDRVATLTAEDALEVVVALALADAVHRAAVGAEGVRLDLPGPAALAAYLDHVARLGAAVDDIAAEGDVPGVVAAFFDGMSDAERTGVALEPRLRRAREAGGCS
jgi:hypothetical protein